MIAIKKILDTVELTNRRHGLFKKNESLLVGLSGGPDSTALLAVLGVLRHKYALKIAAAHLNHGLRGAQSLKDERFAHEMSARWGVPFYSKKIDLRKIAAHSKRSLEDAGRIERYRFFEQAAGKCRCRVIATAHTRDDQAETVLLRLLRGAGLKGLSGIPEKRASGSFTVIRPFLDVEKSEILKFLKANHLPYRLDRSNEKEFFLRNRVRGRLLPLLEKEFNPNIRTTLANLRAISAEIHDYLEGVSQKAFTACVAPQKKKNTVRLSLKRLRRFHPAVQRQVLMKALERVKGDLKRVAFSQVQAVSEILKKREPRDLETHFSGSIRARCAAGQLEFVDTRFE